MTTHPFTDPDAFAAVEDLAEGGTWLLDLVSAVDHLRRGHRPGLTVWEAIAEALGDPGTAAGDGVLDEPRGDLHTDDRSGFARTQTAVRRWVTMMADRYNNGRYWPHPRPRRGFPSPMLAVGDEPAEDPEA